MKGKGKEREEADAISIKQELKRKVYVLAVDDQYTNLTSLEQLLNSEDLEVVCASSGPEALKALLKNEFCCILLDIRMPDMDGFEVAQIIRSDREFAQTPIIFVTAEAKDQDAVFMGYSSGAVDFLVKPLSPHVLKAKVSVFADMFRQRKALDKSKLIEQIYRQLKESNDQLKQYTHIASHDMREPVRRICCLADLLEVEGAASQNSEIESLCRDLRFCSERMIAIVDDFRDLTTIVNAPYSREDVSLRELIEDQIGFRKEDLSRRGIVVDIQNQPVLKVNRRLVNELIHCLLDNAIVHTGEKPVEIRFKAERIEGEWVMGVCNSGSTVDPSISDLIFQPFIRKSAYATAKSRGLGLTKAKKIVEHHHGQIWVEPISDGVCFKYTLAGIGDD